MKKQILLFFFTAVTGIFSYGQCDKKIILAGNSYENLNVSDEVQSKDDRAISIEYDTKLITFTAGDITLQGIITATTCNWKIPFKEGKTVFKTTLTRTDGTTVDGTMTIEGKDGRNILIMEFEGSDYQKQRLRLEKFEESK